MTCQCENVEFGSYYNQIEVEAPAHMKGMEIGCLTIKETICLDKCVAEEVMSLWTLGIITTGCCCGHNKLHGYIGVYGAESIRMMKKLDYKLEPGRTDHFIAQYKPTMMQTPFSQEILTFNQIDAIKRTLSRKVPNIPHIWEIYARDLKFNLHKLLAQSTRLLIKALQSENNQLKAQLAERTEDSRKIIHIITNEQNKWAADDSTWLACENIKEEIKDLLPKEQEGR